MKNYLVVSFIIISTFIWSSIALAAKPKPLPSTDNVIYGCYKKANGQLRVVTGLGQCRPSELSIFWNVAGPQGPQGPTGVVATYTFGGGIRSISNDSRQWVFAGPTATVTTTASQRITGAAQAPLGTTTAGKAMFRYDLCYRAADTLNIPLNFTGDDFSQGEVSDTAGIISFSADASVVPGAGTWEVGYCVWNFGALVLDNNDFVNGWVIITEGTGALPGVRVKKK